MVELKDIKEEKFKIKVQEATNHLSNKSENFTSQKIYYECKTFIFIEQTQFKKFFD
jgi:hypothetical protein